MSQKTSQLRQTLHKVWLLESARVQPLSGVGPPQAVPKSAPRPPGVKPLGYATFSNSLTVTISRPFSRAALMTASAMVSVFAR